MRLRTAELVGYVQATVPPNGRAAIAYELSSARQAVQAMVSELVEHYQVRSLFAVLKRENLRSLRLLEGLGFSLASLEQHVEHQVAPGELLMVCIYQIEDDRIQKASFVVGEQKHLAP
jgi:ribosomal-protein-alanine N-acetyltransferase